MKTGFFIYPWSDCWPDILHTDAIALRFQILAVITTLDLCDHKSFKFLAYLGSRLSILAVKSRRFFFDTAAIAIIGGMAAQSPDDNGCA
jgi:hypothetical protein